MEFHGRYSPTLTRDGSEQLLIASAPSAFAALDPWWAGLFLTPPRPCLIMGRFEYCVLYATWRYEPHLGRGLILLSDDGENRSHRVTPPLLPWSRKGGLL